MELLKVFVGDSAISAAALKKNGMVKGDLLLLDADTHEVATSTSQAVVIAACNDKGVYVSTPITKAGIKYIKYQSPQTANQAIVTVSIDATKIDAGATYSLGIQIKEDLRMGTYNKNTEVIASHVCPSVAADSVWAVASSLAKGFSANPLTSAGSPYQLVSVARTVTGTAMTALAANATVTQGAREVACTAHGFTGGELVNLGGNLYSVEGKRTDNIFTLDTGYQGASATLTAGTTAGSTAAGSMSTTQAAGVKFVFTGIAQSQKNRYDQFRMVDFVVITPKGNDEAIFTSVKTANTPRYPMGSYSQIRDLEEKAYTNHMPLINYREFPFETFPINADPSFTYATFTIAYTSGWGYNMMQSNSSEFLQTVVVAAPEAINGQFDSTLGTANASNFATTWNVWNSAEYTFANLS